MRLAEIDTSYRDNLAKFNVSFKSLVNKEKQIEKIIKTQCSDIFVKYAANRHLGIYKGTEWAHDTAFFGNTHLWKRKSANTINFFTSLIDILPSWKHTAKRSKSLICSTNSDAARLYGNCFLIFPYNDAKISVGGTRDFWINFRENKSTGIEDDFLYAAKAFYMYKVSGYLDNQVQVQRVDNENI